MMENTDDVRGCKAWRYKHSRMCPAHGAPASQGSITLHVSGFMCIGWSQMGSGSGWLGSTCGLFFTWLRERAALQEPGWLGGRGGLRLRYQSRRFAFGSNLKWLRWLTAMAASGGFANAQRVASAIGNPSCWPPGGHHHRRVHGPFRRRGARGLHGGDGVLLRHRPIFAF